MPKCTSHHARSTCTRQLTPAPAPAHSQVAQRCQLIIIKSVPHSNLSHLYVGGR
jgi:hypothetical protein